MENSARRNRPITPTQKPLSWGLAGFSRKKLGYSGSLSTVSASGEFLRIWSGATSRLRLSALTCRTRRRLVGSGPQKTLQVQLHFWSDDSHFVTGQSLNVDGGIIFS